MTQKQNKQMNLDAIPEGELLDARICELPIKIEGTWLAECIDQLYKELEDKRISFRPECYLADEWLTPEGETCIGIPFYLAHPALIKLEKKIMIDAEGETKHWCMKLLRHETGHAVCYAYRFHKRKRWQTVFGFTTQEYADTYKYRPYSKNFVRHLDGYYAQYHPDEDFVETFAVWLTPGLDWQSQYKGWKALQKLKYVDRLMSEIRGKEPPVKNNEKHWRKSSLRIKLKDYYRKKRHFWAEEFPDFHDAFLHKNFIEAGPEHKDLPLASEIIHKYRPNILNCISRHSGERKFVVNDLLKDIQKRSRELNLVVAEDEAIMTLNLSTYITSLIMNYLYTGRFRGEKERRK
ncbi:MAG: hypothetical protein JW847_07825 [Candidatus Omnitrophica bacterium]|nr:hypothetical protein [Candidatus Omnitrophota bacterium]